MTATREDVLSRAIAAFTGLAVGDALGAPAEFMTNGEIRSKYGSLNEMVGGGWLRLKPGQVTDDTEMSLCVARAVAGAGGFSLPAVAEAFATWLRSKPADVGDTCRRGIRAYMIRGSLETPYNQWDGGNGAVMRLLPVALFSLGDPELLQLSAVGQARITHNHQLSDAACVWTGKILHLALLGMSKPRIRRELEDLFQLHPQFRFEPYRGLATGYVVDTIQTVLHHFFCTRSFEDCVIATVNQGGDADTTGAIAGGLSGAFYGLESIPRRWLRKMDRGLLEEIAVLAEKLVRLSPWWRIRGI